MPIKQIFLLGRHVPQRESPSHPLLPHPDRRPPIQPQRGNPDAAAKATISTDPLQVDILSDAIDRELTLPLSCLRAALESRLRHEELQPAETEFLRNLLRSVVSVGEGAERLEQAVRVAHIQPLICSTAELAEIILQHLPRDLRSQTEVHTERSSHALVDAPLLGRALAQVLTSAMHEDSEAHVSIDSGGNRLLISMRVFGGSKQWVDLRARLGLKLLERMGASPQLRCTPSEWSLHATIPTQTERRSEAAA